MFSQSCTCKAGSGASHLADAKPLHKNERNKIDAEGSIAPGKWEDSMPRDEGIRNGRARGVKKSGAIPNRVGPGAFLYRRGADGE